MAEHTKDTIDCGICMIQTLHRVAITDACKAYDIDEGDYVRVYVKKIGGKVES